MSLNQLSDLSEYEFIYAEEYRGIMLNVYLKNNTEMYMYDQIKNSMVPLGSYNAEFKEAIRRYTDRALDTIVIYNEDFGTRLEFFDNAGHRDIRLLRNNRILKVWLVFSEKELDTEKLILEGRKILAKTAEIAV